MDERIQFTQGRWDLPRRGSHVAQLFSLGHSTHTMNNTAIIHQALAPLVGHPLRTIGRAANMVWLHFGEMREVSTRAGGTKTVGDWAVHIQCPWRISQRGRIVIAYHDFYYSRVGDDLDDWDTSGASQFDSAAISLRTEFKIVPPVVASVQPEDVGGFSIYFSYDYRLDVFPDCSFGSSEHWRIFQPGDSSKHFVFLSNETLA